MANKNLKVLIVDDEMSVLESVSKILVRKGYETKTTLSGEEALKVIRNEDFDLIVADLMMPRVSGIDLLKTIRSENKNIPFLVITGYPSISAAVEATKFGAGGFLPKPFTTQELEEAVEKALGGTKEYQAVDTLPPSEEIDVDMPFDAREVARVTSEKYVESLTRTDISIPKTQQVEAASDYCPKGQRSCKKYVKSGICVDVCPFVAKAQKSAQKVAPKIANDQIDVDLPFSFSELKEMTSEAYALSLSSSDIPILGHYQRYSKMAVSPKVLVVDDEAVVVNSIRKILERRGFIVEGVFNGKDALQKVQTNDYNLVLLDMKLGNENGLDLIEKIKKVSPESKIIVVTGFASIESAIQSIRKGANDYLAKPFTPEELNSVAEKNLKVA